MALMSNRNREIASDLLFLMWEKRENYGRKIVAAEQGQTVVAGQP